MSNSEHNTIETAAQIGERQATIDLRTKLIDHPELETAKLLIALDAEGNVSPCNDVMDSLDARMPWPRRRTGTIKLTDAESFIAFAKRWGDANSVIYADTAKLEFVVVMNDHPASAAGQGWRDHRAAYACPRSAEWIAWTSLEGRDLPQTQFADFIEERLADLVVAPGFPAPMDVLAVARALNIKTKGQFQREINPTNGDFILINKLETTSDSTQIPRAFAIAIPVFEGGVRYQIEARVRFKLLDGRPLFSFALHRRAEIERDAFGEVRKTIGEATHLLILSGMP